MSKSHVARRYSNGVAKSRAEEMMEEGLEVIENLGIFQEIPDEIILTSDELLEMDWPFEKIVCFVSGFVVPDKFNIGGFVFQLVKI